MYYNPFEKFQFKFSANLLHVHCQSLFCKEQAVRFLFLNCLDLKSKWPFAFIFCLFLPWVGVLHHMSAKPFREMITHHCQLKCYFWWPFSNFQFLTIHKLNMSGGEEWLKTLHWHEQVMYTSPVHIRGSKCKHIGRPLSYPQIQYVCIHYGHSFR